MGCLYYSLRIEVKKESNYLALTNAFNTGARMPDGSWGIEVKKTEEEYFDFVSYFMKLLDSKSENLEALGVSKDEITVWLLYEYKEQCNLEFSPMELEALARKGVRFCISCWEG